MARVTRLRRGGCRESHMPKLVGRFEAALCVEEETQHTLSIITFVINPYKCCSFISKKIHLGLLCTAQSQGTERAELGRVYSILQSAKLQFCRSDLLMRKQTLQREMKAPLSKPCFT